MAGDHPDLPLTFDEFVAFVGRGQRAQQIVEHLTVYGPGLTFGELAIGDRFYDARPITQLPGAHWPPPRGARMTKTSATGYAWTSGPGGSGTAEAYYRVERA